jgi:imidazole glycerol-phosphate synthase subunit HisH
MLTIIDYGTGNLNSVANMIRYVGGTCQITSEYNDIANAEKLILPGVGAFDQGIKALNERNITNALSTAVLGRGVPILGICLGMQLMTKHSEEGHLPGLGWLDAEVRKFRFHKKSTLKVPHMGWNNVFIQRANPLVHKEERQRFYFVHSYHVVCAEEVNVVATCNYGYDFVAAFSRGNIFGVQFHPEKSHRFGMTLLKSFLERGLC